MSPKLQKICDDFDPQQLAEFAHHMSKQSAQIMQELMRRMEIEKPPAPKPKPKLPRITKRNRLKWN